MNIECLLMNIMNIEIVSKKYLCPVEKPPPSFTLGGFKGFSKKRGTCCHSSGERCAQPIDQCPRLSTLQMPGVDILRMKSTKKMKKKHHKSCFDE